MVAVGGTSMVIVLPEGHETRSCRSGVMVGVIVGEKVGVSVGPELEELFGDR
jgi:hypothetical protein